MTKNGDGPVGPARRVVPATTAYSGLNASGGAGYRKSMVIPGKGFVETDLNRGVWALSSRSDEPVENAQLSGKTTTMHIPHWADHITQIGEVSVIPIAWDPGSGTVYFAGYLLKE